MADQPRVLGKAVWVDGVKWSVGTTPPREVAEKITNPRVWADPGTGDASQTRESARSAGTSDGRRLARTVHVGGQKYRPGDAIPDEVARQITNPNAWEDAQAPDPDTIDGGSGGPEYQPQVKGSDGEQGDDDGETHGDGSVPPPRSGKGSGIGPWRAFADANGVTYPPEANRDDIIDACVEAKVIPAE